MAKKKALSNNSTELQNNSKKIISIQHREIKHSNRKFDNAFVEKRLWLPLQELPLWLFLSYEMSKKKQIQEIIKNIFRKLLGEKLHG